MSQPWIIVIAPTDMEGRRVALEVAREYETGYVDYGSPRTGLRKFEGTRPDYIVIVDYLHWGRGTSQMWDWIRRTILKRPGTKRVWR